MNGYLNSARFFIGCFRQNKELGLRNYLIKSDYLIYLILGLRIGIMYYLIKELGFI